MRPKLHVLGRSEVLIVLAALLLAGCGAEIHAAPRAWIDAPREGSEVPLGEAVEVRSHAYAPDGVREVELLVDGQPYRREPPGIPGATFSGLSQTWVPDTPGDHVLHIVAYGNDGRASAPAMVRVRVVEAIQVAGVTITPLVTSNIPPVTMTPTATSRPALQLNVWVDRPDLLPGECTTLHWEIEGAIGVFLDGQEVADHGARQVCPPTTTLYRFQAQGTERVEERTLMVTVSSPPEMSPPAISSVASSVSRIYKPNCQPNVVTFSANVSDSSGVSGVELMYRVVEGTRVGQWRSLTMSLAGGQHYQAALGWEQLRLSLDPPVLNHATIEYYIRATDPGGHQGQSGVFSVALDNCLV